jgi:hypothetical protein
MTEEEWLRSASPVAMLHHLDVDGDARKALLYAAALLGLHPELLTHRLPMWRRVVEDILVGRKPLRALGCIETAEEYEHTHLLGSMPPERHAHYAAIADALFCRWSCPAISHEAEAAEARPIRSRHAALVRDIFGNPYRPVAFAPGWRTDTAVTLARTMYEAREFGAMPILADALQDAGCENPDILDHCRDVNQPHVRGCWVVDLVLGKE